jgi:hypothetical protein
MTGGPGLLGPAFTVPLDRSGRRWALIREPTGFDEQCVGGRTTLDAVRLIDRLLVDHPAAAVQPGDAASVTVPERDLLLAAAWVLGWGPSIAATVTCAGCAAPFDLDFELGQLSDQVRGAGGELSATDGVVILPSGARFRLPTAMDESAVIGLPPAEAERVLLARCLISGDTMADGPAVEAAMERIGSGIDVDLAARCPECRHEGTVRFQIQDYLLGTICTDWPSLVEDLHRIALVYRWSLHEILSLARSHRRAFVALLDGDPVPRAAELR